MDLKRVNNKKINVTDIDDQVFTGLAIYENKEDFETQYDGISIKTSEGWIKIFENEIKAIKVLN